MVDKIWYNMEELIGGSEERGINRNILECKADRKAGLYDLAKVLIETYWNVKKISIVLPHGTPPVLIETYWNVKISYTLLLQCFLAVLIETYWNVKGEEQGKNGQEFGINRNILECKEPL